MSKATDVAAAVADARKRVDTAKTYARKRVDTAKTFVREKITGRTVYLSLFAVILIAHGIILTLEGGDETTDGNPGLLIFSIIAMVLIGGLFSWGVFNPIDNYDESDANAPPGPGSIEGATPGNNEGGEGAAELKGGKNECQAVEKKKKSIFQQLQTSTSVDLVFAMSILFLVATFQATIGIVSGVGPGGKKAVVSTAGYLGIFGAASILIYGMYKFVKYKTNKGDAKTADDAKKKAKVAEAAAEGSGGDE